MSQTEIQKAYFGGGCFWCTEAIFQELKGVQSVKPGYAGGTTDKPTYEDVCTGNTGHAEVIEIAYDPSIISYPVLLDVFFHTHNPTTRNMQGHDVGTQYRSIILYTTNTQQHEAMEYIQQLEQSKEYPNPIVTEVVPLSTFYEAEAYHKNYYLNNPNNAYCSYVITPKISEFQERYIQLKK